MTLTRQRVPTLEAIFHFSSEHLSSYVIPISLLEEVTSILHVQYGHLTESKAPKSSALVITHHSVKGMTRSRGNQLYYASLQDVKMYRTQFGWDYCLVLGNGCKVLGLPLRSYSKTKEIATTHLLLSVLLQLDPNRYYKWLGWKSFVVLWKPGDTCPFAMECIISLFDKKVWLGHYSDRLCARTLAPKNCTGK